MNAKDRDEIQKLIGQVDDIKSQLEIKRDEEQEKVFSTLKASRLSILSVAKIWSRLDDAISDCENMITNCESAMGN